MADIFPIDNGLQQSSYQEFSIQIPAGSFYKLDNPYNYFRCLSANQPFSVSWGSNVGRTNFEAGLGIKFNSVLPSVLIFNDSGAPLVVSVGLGIGEFDDSRLSVSGTILTNPAPYAFFGVQQYTFSGGQVEIPAASKLLIQNTGTANIYIGGTGTNGLVVVPLGSFELEYSGALTVYGTDGQTISVGSFS